MTPESEPELPRPSVDVGSGDATRRGSPFASDKTCILGPGLPRSTGLGPVCSPAFALTWAESRTTRETSMRPTSSSRAAPPHAASPRRPLSTRSRTVVGGYLGSLCPQWRAAGARRGALAGPLGPHPVPQRLPADPQVLADALERVLRVRQGRRDSSLNSAEVRTS